MSELAIKLIDMMDEKVINVMNNEGKNTPLFLACKNSLNIVAIKLIKRMSYETINKNIEKNKRKM